MEPDSYEIRVLFRHYWKKGLNAAAAAREICNREGMDAVVERTAQKLFKRFKDGHTRIEYQPHNGRPCTFDQEALTQAVQGEPATTTRILSVQLSTSKSTIGCQLNSLGLVNKCPREIPQKLTPE